MAKQYRIQLQIFFKKSIYVVDDYINVFVCETLNNEKEPTMEEIDKWMQSDYLDGTKRYEDFIQYLYVCGYGQGLKNIKYYPGGRIVFEISECLERSFNSSKEEVFTNIITDSFEDSFYEGMPGSTLIYPSKNLPEYALGEIDCRDESCIIVEEI